MSGSYLLDTCAVIWIANGDPIDTSAQDAISSAYADRNPVYISPISAWEIGTLVSRGRLKITGRPNQWYSTILATPGVSSALMPEGILIESAFLPGTPPNDPADRIVISTAREYGLTIVTRDAKILKYADEGHVAALLC